MSKQTTLSLTEEEKESYIKNLSNELVTLRTQANLSQEELASIIGVSRQTYGTIERKLRLMSWDTYLALIMFFDYHHKTHDLLRSLGCFPYDIIKRFNDNDKKAIDLSLVSPIDTDTLIEKLDEQAINNIKMIIMIEYARCTKTAGEAIIKSFDGVSFSNNTEHNNNDQKDGKPVKRRGRPRKNSIA